MSSKRTTLHNSKYEVQQPTGWLPWLHSMVPYSSPIPKTAYIFIAIHGSYPYMFNDKLDVPKNIRDMSEPFLQEESSFSLKETGINNLTWVRSVAGGLCNYLDEEGSTFLYSKYREYVKGTLTFQALIAELKKFKQQDDGEDYYEDIDEDRRSYTNARDKRYEIKEFSILNNSIINNKIFSVKDEYNPDKSPDMKIILLNTEEDITTKVLEQSAEQSDSIFLRGSLDEILNYLYSKGYTDVVLFDESCSSVYVDNEKVSQPKYLSTLRRDLDRRGGYKKKINVTRRKSTRRKYKLHIKLPWSGWKNDKPYSTRERNIMQKKCGQKCFLGTKNSFPICTKGTCNINKKGLWAAYIRAREWGSNKIKKKSGKHTRKYYKKIANQSLRLLK
jgi:hypothetical protein